jgi:hypothetical protein
LASPGTLSTDRGPCRRISLCDRWRKDDFLWLLLEYWCVDERSTGVWNMLVRNWRGASHLDDSLTDNRGRCSKHRRGIGRHRVSATDAAHLRGHVDQNAIICKQQLRDTYRQVDVRWLSDTEGRGLPEPLRFGHSSSD